MDVLKLLVEQFHTMMKKRDPILFPPTDEMIKSVVRAEERIEEREHEAFDRQIKALIVKMHEGGGWYYYCQHASTVLIKYFISLSYMKLPILSLS
jgi:hypothetical protein